MDIVEVASYPRSDKTWLCNIISQYCQQQRVTVLIVKEGLVKNYDAYLSSLGYCTE